MVFTSLEFLTLFLPGFFILYGLTPIAWRNVTLLLGSWLFYAWWSPMFLVLLIGITFIAWLGALAMENAWNAERPTQLKRWLALLIIINVGILCWFKYANISVNTYNELAIWLGAMPIEWQRIVLPAGLSFFILQAISYLVDVQRRTVKAQPSFVDFAAYIAMFGQLIAGPIIRYEWVHQDLADRIMNWANFRQGARRFMIGMSMKVLIADTLAPIADIAFALPEPSMADAWLGCGAYTLQLFFDFAGYSAMAIGLGQMMGFHFPENFNNPYLARNIQDFWRRWHLSLSSWIRDYLYIPLGGNRYGVWKTYRNLLLTMGIAGLWHGGDSWNFLFWGLAHGVALSMNRLWHEANWPALPGALAHTLTLLFVMLAWTLFRATDFNDALIMYKGQFGLNALALGDVLTLAWRPAHWLAAIGGIACVVAPLAQPWFNRQAFAISLSSLRGIWPLMAFMLSYSLLASRGSTPFLYFQF
ncbi:MBOAT family O-acyltransferase [Neopusillimonas aromaticivorans]|uniref:MBOAT family O-acyltransferase n=1 Tax=Neopusillimonas aromaticivorans TaxID=2979868 RepID=UPI002598C478|nr:MBOAT family O-acyltransferase [Neopusillimonas aromaticivorans]WJJ94303.1 MBOAT family O-acyltransferase [Neopusillimonas aromaticivorans]